MIAPTLLAVAAVLAGGQVSLVDVTRNTVTGTVTLPGSGAAIFAAPDGSLVVPLADSEETVLVELDGRLQRWRGRVFPLFFDEPDRMYVVTNEALLSLAFPQRAQIARVPLPGLHGAYRAAVSSNGLAVALLAAPPERRELALVIPRGESHVEKMSLACVPSALTIDPAGGWVLTGCQDGHLELLAGGETPVRGGVQVAGAVVGLAAAADGRSAVAAVAGEGRGWLVGLRVRPRARRTLKESFTTSLPGPPSSVAVSESASAATCDGRLVLLRRGGRKVSGEITIPGARAVVFLPEEPVSTQPSWSD